MQVTSFLMLALSTLSAAAPAALQARDGATVVADIGSISNAIDGVNSKVSSFNGDTFQALAVLGSTNNLVSTIQKSSKDAQASEPFTSEESNNVAGAVLELQPKIGSSLDLLVSKKPQFEKAIFGFSSTFIVLNSLKSLRQETTYLGGNITQKLTPDFAAIAPTVISEIDGKFASAIAAFQ